MERVVLASEQSVTLCPISSYLATLYCAPKPYSNSHGPCDRGFSLVFPNLGISAGPCAKFLISFLALASGCANMKVKAGAVVVVVVFTVKQRRSL